MRSVLISLKWCSPLYISKKKALERGQRPLKLSMVPTLSVFMLRRNFLPIGVSNRNAIASDQNQRYWLSSFPLSRIERMCAGMQLRHSCIRAVYTEFLLLARWTYI